MISDKYTLSKFQGVGDYQIQPYCVVCHFLRAHKVFRTTFVEDSGNKRACGRMSKPAVVLLFRCQCCMYSFAYVRYLAHLITWSSLVLGFLLPSGGKFLYFMVCLCSFIHHPCAPVTPNEHRLTRRARKDKRSPLMVNLEVN